MADPAQPASKFDRSLVDGPISPAVWKLAWPTMLQNFIAGMQGVVDHALVGGVLARRWNLPKSVASAIERHHADDAQGDAAFVRLADMLAHYSQGSPVSSTELLRAARAVGFGPSELRAVLYDLPYPSKDRPRSVEPCPLSTRELEVLKRLAQGMVYKQIALELSLSTSTVRTHLHNIYGKLGAVDRAQAVLHATERGWL